MSYKDYNCLGSVGPLILLIRVDLTPNNSRSLFLMILVFHFSAVEHRQKYSRGRRQLCHRLSLIAAGLIFINIY